PAMSEDQSQFPFVSGRKGRVIRAPVLGVQLVEFTYHAVQRMSSREIREEDVLSAVRNPTCTGLSAEPGTEHIRWQRDRRTFIDVVYAMTADRVGIITVWKSKRSSI